MLLNLISIFFTIISLIYAIYCHNILKKAELKERTIDWQDVNVAAKYLAQEIGEQHKPDLIFIPNIKSGILVHFIKDYFMEYIPIIVGQSISKKQFSENSINKIANKEQYLFFETKKWYCYIPKSIIAYKDKKIIIIDDFAMSGDFLQALKITLIKAGFQEEQIITMCIATTKVAIKSENAPTFYWKGFATTDVYMPWGKSI